MPPNNRNYNADELEAPAWLNDEFFTKVLHNFETEAKSLRLKCTELSPATLKGDHYASVMFRATIEYECDGEDKSKRMIIKTMPSSEGQKKEMFEKSYIFETEIGMYTEVIPRFEQILRDIGDETVLRAPILFHELSPEKIIILEDIVPLGYEMLRERYLTNEELKAAYSKLAKWHAISYKINLEEPQYFEKYRQGLLAVPKIEKSAALASGVDYLINNLKTMPTLSEYVPLFEQLKSKLFPGAIASFKEYRDARREDGYYVLCHGDFHNKNMMFKQEASTGKLVDVMLLDYQLCYVGPMVNDLIYSFFMLLDSEHRESFPELVHFYFTEFKETLQKIGHKGSMPKLMKIHQQRMQHKYLELFLLITFLPAWLAFRGGDVGQDDFLTSDDCRTHIYAKKEFAEELQKLLPKYLHLGYFEQD
ncbi:uncharacterized protein LOC118750462 [Rhagoletis pomonella]|uniref:uncharacterized protein LOC118750462 n=1 Tax=Rhagoletis pomonella TaxID=28610 RepID=UPI00177BACA5|nr:uncharacterized protein LOC118750462 [Rhagoletis pomonella]